MSYALIRETFPNARKPHRCIWCGEAIPVGLNHRHEISVFEGRWQNHRWHRECDTAAVAYFAHGDCEFNAHENERPE